MRWIGVAFGVLGLTWSACGRSTPSSPSPNPVLAQPFTLSAMPPSQEQALDPTTIGGTVFDAGTSQPIAGATVEVVSPTVQSLRTTTDGNGRYRLSGIQSVDFTIRYSHPEYQTFSFPYAFEPGTEQLALVTRLTIRELKGVFIGTYTFLQSGQSTQLNALAWYSDGTERDVTFEATWFMCAHGTRPPGCPPLNDGPSTLSPTGLVTALRTGSAPACVTFLGRSACVGIQIVQNEPGARQLRRVTINGPSTLRIGDTEQLSAQALYSDGTVSELQNAVEWVSMTPRIASVTESGVLAPISLGSSMIAAYYSNVRASHQVTVVPGNPQRRPSSIIVVGSNLLRPGESMQPTATAILEDGSTRDVTREATWTSTNSHVAAVNATGWVTAAGVGTSTISANVDDLTGRLDITVVPDQRTSFIMIRESRPGEGTTLRRGDSSTRVLVNYSRGSVQPFPVSVVACLGTADRQGEYLWTTCQSMRADWLSLGAYVNPAIGVRGSRNARGEVQSDCSITRTTKVIVFLLADLDERPNANWRTEPPSGGPYRPESDLTSYRPKVLGRAEATVTWDWQPCS